MTSKDKAVVIASDGIWDRFSNEEVTKLVMDPEFYEYKDADSCASWMIKEAVVRWKSEQGMIDDITIIIAYLNVPEKVDSEGMKRKTI